MSLLKSITGMQHGKGMPKENDIAELKQWCSIDGVVDMSLLKSITGMQAGKGMLKREVFVRLINEYKGKFNGNGAIITLPDMKALKEYTCHQAVFDSHPFDNPKLPPISSLLKRLPGNNLASSNLSDNNAVRYGKQEPLLQKQMPQSQLRQHDR